MPQTGATERDADVVAVAVGGVLLWRLPQCRLHERQPVVSRRHDDDDSGD
jgi:hypothetical protein